jgi:hypothetical protein
VGPAGYEDGTLEKISSKEYKAYTGSLEDISRDAYPEIATHIIAINTPWFLNLAWKTAKNFVPARTLRKVVVFGFDYVDAIQNYISLENLAVECGGLSTSPSFPKVWTKLTIARGTREDTKLEVASKGDHFKLDFHVEAYDILLALAIEDSEGKTHEVVAEAQYDAGLHALSTTLPMAGTPVLLWNNHYSWVTAKVVMYMAECVGHEEPGEEGKEVDAIVQDILDQHAREK